MKKLILGIGILLIAASGYAQKDLINTVFEKYGGAEGFTTIDISGDMLNMMTKAEMEKRDTVFQSKLSQIRVLVRNKDCEKPAVLNLKSEVFDKLDKSVYKEMISIKQTDGNVEVLINEAGGHISEMVILVGGSNDNVLVHVKGDILLSEITDMMGKFPMKGMEHLNMMEQ